MVGWRRQAVFLGIDSETCRGTELLNNEKSFARIERFDVEPQLHATLSRCVRNDGNHLRTLRSDFEAGAAWLLRVLAMSHIGELPARTSRIAL